MKEIKFTHRKLIKTKVIKTIAWMTISILILFLIPGGIKTVYAVETIRKTTKKKGFFFEQAKEKIINFFIEKKENEVTFSKKGILITTVTIILLVSICYQSQNPSFSQKLSLQKLQELGPAVLSPEIIKNTASWQLLKADKTVGFSKTALSPLVKIMLNSDFQELMKTEMTKENITNLIFAFQQFKGI